ncbi:MAG: hypothetical protein N3A38_09950 [Planctomycetota bacterium]|nr:hypothetical protein [Planctomycetota bacterium]
MADPAGKIRMEVAGRFAIPELRLRIHSEMAVARRPGGTWLVAASYSNAQASLIFIRPDGSGMRTVPMPGRKRGGGMIQADGDGMIYCGANDLYRVDPDTGRSELLAAGVIPNDGIWGGGVTSKLVVLGSSTPDNMLVLYDRRAGRVARVIRPLHPRAFYVYRALEAPDGRVLVMSSLPRAVATLVDQDSLDVEQFEPEALTGATNWHAGQFIAPEVFFAVSGNMAFLFEYPGFRTVARIPPPEGVSGFSRTSFVLGGRVGIWGMGTNMLYLLDAKRCRWEPMLDGPVVPVRSDEDLYCSAYAALDDGSVCGFTADCVFFRVEPGGRAAKTERMDIRGPVMAWGPMAVVNEPGFHKAWGSTHVVQRFWEVDLETGAGRDLGDSGPGGGQVNDMLWDPEQRMLFLASYGSCTLLAWDPRGDGRFPENPRVIARIGHDQMRPIQLLRRGSAAWMISNSHYSHFGGALSRICLRTGRTDVYRSFLATLAPTRMLVNPLRPGELCISTTIHADCGSAVPLEKEAKLFVFDMNRREVLQEMAPRPGAQTLKLMAFTEDGREALYLDGGDLWAWEPAGGPPRRVGAAPAGLREIVPGPEGKGLWATGYDGIGPLLPGDTCRIEPAVPTELTREGFGRMGKYLTWDGDTLWFTNGLELIGVVPEGARRNRRGG